MMIIVMIINIIIPDERAVPERDTGQEDSFELSVLWERQSPDQRNLLLSSEWIEQHCPGASVSAKAAFPAWNSEFSAELFQTEQSSPFLDSVQGQRKHRRYVDSRCGRYGLLESNVPVRQSEELRSYCGRRERPLDHLREHSFQQYDGSQGGL